jgi:hypothetical protein
MPGSESIPKAEEKPATQAVGLPKGTLSDNEIAQKVAREFFEALSAKDYAKAATLCEGLTAKELEKNFEEGGELHYLKIISVGAPKPPSKPETGGVEVPCVVTAEATFNLGVRSVHNQPDKWQIFGGF